MDYRDQTLYLEELPLADIARREGTPSYVYSSRRNSRAVQCLR